MPILTQKIASQMKTWLKAILITINKKVITEAEEVEEEEVTIVDEVKENEVEEEDEVKVTEETEKMEKDNKSIKKERE